MRRILLPLCALTIGAAPSSALDVVKFVLGQAEADAVVVTDVTTAGKESPQPTPDKPVYYFYKEAGFKELGEIVAGEKHPDPKLFRAILEKTLAKQGYLPASRTTPPPTIILVASWGSLNPVRMEVPGFEPDEPGEDGMPAEETLSTEVVTNKKMMLMMVGANKYAQEGWINFEYARVLDEAADDRYFIFVSAYDVKAALRKEKKPLWFTRISVPSNGITFPDVMSTLIASGGPYFGKETKKVEFIDPEKRRNARVEIGEAVVVPEDTPAGAVAVPQSR